MSDKENKNCCCGSMEHMEEIQPSGEQGAIKSCCCHERKKVREPEEYKKLLNRLSRIEGQIRGIRRMLETDAYCPDILTQSAAATAALNAFSRELLSEHIRGCVKNDILEGHDETIDELLDTLRKMMH